MMMRRQQPPRALRPVVGRQAQIPAPVGGLNARDALTGMPEQDALELTNIIPETTFCRLRRGYTEWATGISDPVETLMEWAGPSREFFAAAGDSIYDVTASGAVGTAVVTGLANARFQHIMFSNAAGNFIVAVNGADGVQTYDGTTWATQTLTGVTAANLFQVASWKRRLWFAEQGTPNAWYLGVDAIAGAANSLNLGSVWRSGGTLVRIISTSYDTTASGAQDYIGFVSSKGEIAVYQGTDPTSAGTFGLVGVFVLGSPVGNRCSYQSGGDTVVLTNDGALSLLEMMRVGDRTAAPRAAITDKIGSLVSADTGLYGPLFGWQIIGYPAAHLAVLNVPTSTTTARQYVMNAITGAWCQWSGHNAACWSLFNDRLYFGGFDGVVYRADDGTNDNGNAIPWTVKTAYQDFGSAGVQKRFTLLRPIMLLNGVSGFEVGLDVDYGNAEIFGVLSAAISAAQWDVALWDVDVWGGQTMVRDWASVGPIGRVASAQMRGSSIGVELTLNAFDIMMEPSRVPGL
jgi:hypothetical protein